MKHFFQLLFLALLLFSGWGCSPHYYAERGDYDKALDLLADRVRFGSADHLSKRIAKQMETSFRLATENNLREISRLEKEEGGEKWIEAHQIYQKMKDRQKKISSLGAMQTRKGYIPQFSFTNNIDSLELTSRNLAAEHLYQKAHDLLALTQQTGQKKYARDAWYALYDLTRDYDPNWKDALVLMDSSFREGQIIVVGSLTFIPNQCIDPATAKDFWKEINLKNTAPKSRWITFLTDTAATLIADFVVEYSLTDLNLGKEETSSTSRMVTVQVEDGYEEKVDSSGKVIERTQKYKDETKFITTWSAERNAQVTVTATIYQHNAVYLRKNLRAEYNSSEESETMAVSAPSSFWMMRRTADNLEYEIKQLQADAERW